MSAREHPMLLAVLTLSGAFATMPVDADAREPARMDSDVLASTATAGTCTFDAARQHFQTLLVDESLPGGAMLLGTRDGLLLEQYFGAYTADTVIPIASATKLLSAVRIAQLAEQGAIDLDAPVSTYLPQFSGLKGTMTVAQMFSHTAGYGEDSLSPVLIDPDITLAEAVDEIACCVDFPNDWTPGGQFAYGGVSMHVAGRVSEVVGGGDWNAQWRARVGEPLGISSISWNAANGSTNYGIAGMASANLRDYGRVLRMLASGGWADGVQLLHPSTIATMRADRVGDLPVAYAPPNAALTGVGYGLGGWIDPSRPDTQLPLMHSLGAFGFFPFVDFERGLFGVFMIRGQNGVNSRALPVYLEMLDAVFAQFDGGNCEPIERFAGISGDGFESPPATLPLP